MGLSEFGEWLVGSRTCPLCTKERKTSKEIIGEKCKNKIFGKIKCKLINQKCLVFSIFPYTNPNLRRLILQAKIGCHPQSLNLILKLWQKGLEKIPELNLTNSALIIPPRPWERWLIKGPGIVKSLSTVNYFNSHKKINVLRAHSGYFSLKPHTRFKIKKNSVSVLQKFQHILIIDDLLTTGSTLHRISNLIQTSCPRVNIIGFTLAHGASQKLTTY